MIKDNNLISLNLISNDGNIHLTIFVNPNISCATLMTIMSEEIKKIYPDFSPENIYFYMQVKIWFLTHVNCHQKILKTETVY